MPIPKILLFTLVGAVIGYISHREKLERERRGSPSPRALPAVPLMTSATTGPMWGWVWSHSAAGGERGLGYFFVDSTHGPSLRVFADHRAAATLRKAMVNHECTSPGRGGSANGEPNICANPPLCAWPIRGILTPMHASHRSLRKLAFAALAVISSVASCGGEIMAECERYDGMTCIENSDACWHVVGRTFGTTECVRKCGDKSSCAPGYESEIRAIAAPPGQETTETVNDLRCACVWKNGPRPLEE